MKNGSLLFSECKFNTGVASAALKGKEVSLTVNPISIAQNYNNLVVIEQWILSASESRDIPLGDELLESLEALHHALNGQVINSAEAEELSEAESAEMWGRILALK